MNAGTDNLGSNKGHANLIPAKPGEVRNPNGRPLGSKNRATVLRELLELTIEGRDLCGKETKMPVETAVMQALITKAMSGDVPAVKEIQDTIHGKVPDKSELSGPNGGPIETAMPEADKLLMSQYLKHRTEESK